MVHWIVIHINEGAADKQAVVLRNATNLMTALGPETTIELVTHGPGISLAVGAASPTLAAVLELGVTVCVCRNSMASANLTDAELFPGARIVPSGMAHLVIRQGEGWAYLRP